MIKVVGVRFKNAGKVYYFDPDIHQLEINDNVIVETARGVEFGTITMGPEVVNIEEIVSPLKKIMRKATPEDEKRYYDNDSKRGEALETCQRQIEKHGLDMKLIDVEYTFDNNKIIFYFTANGRVDFRDLVKDLASVYRMRIELRQIGVRDEAKLLGGIGNCGRGLCCHQWLSDFHPVSIKMAKVQNLSLNPTKISGICGRLMCCLKYENDVYNELKKGLPEVGERVVIDEGTALVCETNVLESKVKCRVILEEGDRDKNIYQKLSTEVYTYNKDDVRRQDRRRRDNKRRKNPAEEKLSEELEMLED